MLTSLHNTRKQKMIFLYNLFIIIILLGHGDGELTIFLDYQLVQMSIKQ